MRKDNTFGNEFERIVVGLLAVVTGVLLIYLAIQGPLFLGNIHYKSAPVIDNQIIGQDVVNLFLLSLISITGGIAVAAALLLVWLNLAVGIIGSEDNPGNLLYFCVLGVGITGAAVARLRPLGMARALFATALAQALVPVIALAIGGSQARSMQEPPGVWGVLVLNAFFVMLFVVSALLFRHSAPGRSEKGAD